MSKNNQFMVAANDLLPVTKVQPEQNSEPNKRSINPILYCINLLMMVSIPFYVVFFIFYDQQQLLTKGYVGIFMVFWCFSILLPTIIYLKVSMKNLFKTFIIFDSMWLCFSLQLIAFIGLMHFLDQGRWEIKILQLAFCVGAITKIINVRLLLLFMKWKPIQVICFKLGIVVMALTYFNIGVYCLYTNFSYTYNILIGFDQQVRYFIVLFTFTGFDFIAKLLKIMSNFDYSDTFRNAYVIKDMNGQSDVQFKKRLQLFKEIHTKKIKELAKDHLIHVSKMNRDKNQP